MDIHSPLARDCDPIVEAAYRADQPGAVVLLLREGEVLYRRALGMADLEMGVPLAPAMAFRIASLTKPFTAAAILRLAEAGRLALDDPLTRHLPDFPERGITLEHLLSHTSGLPEYTTLPEWAAGLRLDTTPAALAALFQSKPLLAEPGAAFAYCNSGYVALGMVIEKASGLPYAEYLKREIVGPAGLEYPQFDDLHRVLPGRVRGYQAADAGFIHAEFFPPSQSYSAGGLIAAAEDVCRWVEALFAGRVLRPESLRRAFEPFRLLDGSAAPYGFGWFAAGQDGEQTVEHLGLYPGFAHFLIGMPTRRLSAVALTNRARGAETPAALLRAVVSRALA